MTEKILVPLDLSHAGAKVLDTAVEMAERRGAELVLMTVLPTIPAIVDSFMESDYQEKAARNARTALEARLEEKGLAKDGYEILIKHGTPHDKVIKCAKDIGASLIVVASQAPSTVGDYLLGSTSAKIVRHASCSVFVVRNG